MLYIEPDKSVNKSDNNFMKCTFLGHNISFTFPYSLSKNYNMGIEFLAPSSEEMTSH